MKATFFSKLSFFKTGFSFLSFFFKVYLNSVLAPVNAGAPHALTAPCSAHTSSWLPGTRCLLCSHGRLPVEVKVRDPCASLAGGRVCSAAALGQVGTPTRHCHGHTYPSIPSQPPLANWKFFLHLFPQNGQTLRSVRRNGPETPQMAGSLGSGCLCPWEAFVKWAGHSSVRGCSPAQAQHR